MNLELVEWLDLDIWIGTLSGLGIFGVLIVWTLLTKPQKRIPKQRRDIMSGLIIKTCPMGKCQSNYQDATFGTNQRAFNCTDRGWRCTVCGTDRLKSSLGKGLGSAPVMKTLTKKEKKKAKK